MKNILSLVLFITLFIPVSAQESTSANDWSYSYDFIENGIKCVNIKGKIFKNAYFTSTDESGNYAFITWDKTKAYVNINGKRLGPYDYVNEKNFADITPVVLSEGGRYAFMYSLKGKKYVNVNGKILGPYPAIDSRSIKLSPGGNYSFTYLVNQNSRFVMLNAKKYGPFANERNMAAEILDDGTYYFEYSDKDGNYFININGRVHKMEECEHLGYKTIKYYSFLEKGKWYLNNAGSILGPYDSLALLSADPGKNRVSFKYKSANDWFISINGNISGPYSNIEIPSKNLFHGDVYVYRFFAKKGQFLNINGKILGPYNYTKRITVLDENNFVFAYETNNRWYVNLNGEKAGSSYGLIDDVALNKSGTYAFAHRDKADVTISHLNVNKKEKETYPGYVDEVYLSPTGNIITLANNKYWYANVSDKHYGPYFEVNSLYALDSGEFFLTATDRTRKIFSAVINGMEFGPFERLYGLHIGEGGRYIFIARMDGKFFLNDTGEIKGPFEEISQFRPSGNWKIGNFLTQ
ncbi:MAG: hypothetical protein PHV09_08945 [Bacteroidales bacterium]|jgi:hypothetical protein|nr:hypothetical protein [Bacteroidales bacterium]MDD4293613.1 hypothetical protein [Bacteroidales bacterium]MDD4492632.1 hypothetical protein [Bacteroidales bacterium]HNW48494.1 hypothetical protein [Bacteroidales bacterium]HPS95340.1 hypothetical protein [Bacteroidales bacterium]